MRVAIVSTPRTCSSLMTSIYTNRYNLTNKLGIFSACKTEEDVTNLVDILVTDDDYVVKITATNFIKQPCIQDIATFPWSIFDKIILTERTPIEEQYASWILLSHAQFDKKLRNAEEIQSYIKELLSKDHNSITVRKGDLEWCKQNITYYYEVIKPYLLSTNLPVYVVDHKLFQDDVHVYLDVLNSNLNETFTVDNIEQYTKSSIDYSNFVIQTNLKNLIHDTDE